MSARASGQQFIIENRPAGANISAETVVKASPDAYTLLMVSVANTVNATHYDKLDFNSGKINRASGGNGAPSHVVGELFKMRIGVNIVHVPYRGSAPTLTGINDAGTSPHSPRPSQWSGWPWLMINRRTGLLSERT